MANVKISAAADAGTLLSSDMLPLARSGDSNAYHATMTEVATFTNATLSSGAYNNAGRNLIHNSLFNIQQRGQGPWAATANFTADRWVINLVLDGVNVAPGALSDASRAQIGDEGAENYLGVAVSGNAGATAYTALGQTIEDVRRLGGKTVTVSFYAQGSTGTLKLGASIDQLFGTGGSPSPAVTGTGQSVTLTTGFVRYTLTFAVPSTSGKTLGTNANHGTRLNLWMSAGANSNTVSGSVGVQTGTIYLWGVQLEIGSVATPLDYAGSPQQQLAQCQRFFQVGATQVYGYAAAGTPASTNVGLPVTMRATPLLTSNWTTTTNASAPTITTLGPNNLLAYATATVTGAVNLVGTFTASADI